MAPSFSPESTPYHKWTAPNGGDWAFFYRLDAGFLVRFVDQADFYLASTGEITHVSPSRGTSAQALSYLRSHLVEPLALSLQDNLVLHGSSVEFGGKAVGFLAPGGSGKSTMAAFLATQGYGLLSDDTLLLAFQRGEVTIRPYSTGARLRGDSLESLGLEATWASPIKHIAGKAEVEISGMRSLKETPILLQHLVLLGHDSVSAPQIMPLEGSEALAAVLRNSFLLSVGAPDEVTKQLELAGKVLDEVSVWQLDYPRDFAMLPKVHSTLRRELSLLS